MHRRNRLVRNSLIAVLSTSGCFAGTYVPIAPSVRGPLSPSYPTSASTEYASYLQGGKASIHGQAFLTTRGGEVRLGAGRMVTLDPSTSLARVWLSEVGSIANRFDEAPADSNFLRARRTTTVDAQGNFSFSDLPAGSYIVRTVVSWEVAGEIQGGLLADTVTLGAGDQKTVLLHEMTDPFTVRTGVASDVLLVTAAQARERGFIDLGKVTSKATETTSMTSSEAENIAVAKLRNSAKKLGANAIVDVMCRFNIAISATSARECYGQAVKLK